MMRTAWVLAAALTLGASNEVRIELDIEAVRQ